MLVVPSVEIFTQKRVQYKYKKGAVHAWVISAKVITVESHSIPR